jgi:hypothetical protein
MSAKRRATRRIVLAAGATLATGAVACGADKPGTPAGTGVAAAASTWHGFGFGQWPSASWRPYADSSPFNQRATGERPLPASDQMIAQALRFGPPMPMTVGVAQSSDDWGHPTYYASTTDPVYRLHATAPYGRSPIEGMRIRVPAGAEPAGGGDAHMTIVQPNGWEYDLWRAEHVTPGGGTLSFAWGGRLRVDGSGTRTGGTASRFGNLAGMIRAQELAAGRINHALFVVLRCAGDGSGYPGTRRRARDESAYVFPAVSGGGVCPAGTVAPPMGARLRLNMSRAQIAALHLPRWKTAILLALARYGGYVGDTGGDGIGFMFESSTMYTSLGRPDPLVAVARAAGIPSNGGRYVFDVGSGVDWSRLQVIAPPRR